MFRESGEIPDVSYIFMGAPPSRTRTQKSP